MRLAVLSDLHHIADREAAVGARLGGLADLFLLRLVHRLNRFLKPDATVVLGDLINDGTSPQAAEGLARLRESLDRLAMPWLALPGNHDGDPEEFFRHFPRLPAWLDVAGVRLVPFVDPEEPGYNARREMRDLERLEAVRADGWGGPVVALHHVPVFPPGAHPCPYNLVNAGDVLLAMSRQGVSAAIGGHYHRGFEGVMADGVACLAAPALCESPFAYLVVDVTAREVRVERQQLALPTHLRLADTHVHTHLAYCQENMDIGLTQRLAGAFGLADLRFTEHSGHLYFRRQEYGTRCCREGIAAADPAAGRMQNYLDALDAAGVLPHHRGIEIDCDAGGRPVLRPEHVPLLPFRVGAMHHLPCLADPRCTDAAAADAFLGLLERFLRHGFQVLAHPFRVFRRARRPIPPGIVEPTVRLLRENGTAAEINYHTNEPPRELVHACLRRGVPLTFGSDAHNLYEVGEFMPHLALLRDCGVGDEPGDVLLPLDAR
ncbi:MAG: metallophosphoesterase [Lentisphaeria bacterium]|nr:metallophosphoesterase [Lentisphaeria bacterium]